MKRFVVIAVAAAFCAQLPAVYAQDASEPEEETVLEKAREKYAQDDKQDGSGELQEAPAQSSSQDSETTGESAEASSSEWPYAPWVLSFVPGLQSPYGLHDTSLAFGIIGSAAGNVPGIQVSGVFSLAENVDGFQGAGVFNMAAGDVNGFQGAGVFNMARNVDGFQGAGVFNLAKDVDGFQGAGVFNIAERVDGFQVSGCFNIAGSVDGVMIGIVNVADHLDGVAFGLINLIGDGVNELGVLYSPAEDMTYILYRTGTAGLYGVYYSGLGSEDWFVDGDSLIVGVGLGHRIEMIGGGLDLEFCVEQELYSDRRTALAAAWDAEDEDAFFDLLCPYPSLRASLNVPLFGGLRAFLGLEADFDIPEWGSHVPDRLRVSSFDSDGWSGEVFGLAFTAWPKVFFGVSF